MGMMAEDDLIQFLAEVYVAQRSTHAVVTMSSNVGRYIRATHHSPHGRAVTSIDRNPLGGWVG